MAARRWSSNHTSILKLIEWRFNLVPPDGQGCINSRRESGVRSEFHY
jgi:hypothetical protein